jgi:hypothetical protein
MMAEGQRMGCDSGTIGNDHILSAVHVPHDLFVWNVQLQAITMVAGIFIVVWIFFGVRVGGVCLFCYFYAINSFFIKSSWDQYLFYNLP